MLFSDEARRVDDRERGQLVPDVLPDAPLDRAVVADHAELVIVPLEEDPFIRLAQALPAIGAVDAALSREKAREAEFTLPRMIGTLARPEADGAPGKRHQLPLDTRHGEDRLVRRALVLGKIGVGKVRAFGGELQLALQPLVGPRKARGCQSLVRRPAVIERRRGLVRDRGLPLGVDGALGRAERA